MALTADVAVLGAGAVGVSAALHLQARGRDVVLIDRHAQAAGETSYGNAGIIERSSLFPYAFPREVGTILRYALNRSTDAAYHLSALPDVLPWLVRYFLAGSRSGIARSFAGARPLIERSLVEHEELMEAAGSTALLRKVGWIKSFRHRSSLDKGMAEADRLRSFGLAIEALDPAALASREPHLAPAFVGALHYKDAGAVSDPGGLIRSYADLFVRRQGRLLRGEAASARQEGSRWTLDTASGPLVARDLVIALGPWSGDLAGRLGYRIPLGVKRGYHRHYAARGNAVLDHPVLDADGGFLLAPMRQGIRLTTGAEFARMDAPPTPVQLGRAEPVARALFPLGEAVEATPWMGARPCLPDMLPVIGPGRRHAGLWFDFGHQHHGLTLGPVSGRLLAELLTGETPFTDPGPYAAERFDG